MKILLTGGTGFIGAELLKHLTTWEVVLLTRDIGAAQKKLQHTDIGNIKYIENLALLDSLDGFDAVVNLAGEPIANKRWSEAQKQKICDSRWQTTAQIVELIQASQTPPSVFISGSAVGYYGDQKAHPFDETLHVESDAFAHQVCTEWERIALHAQSERTRVCVIRTGVVLGLDGGALKKMWLPYQLGLGGPIGQGEQYIPWIHLLDQIGAILYLLETTQAHGIFNLCAPHPVTNAMFSKTLAKTLHRPHLLTTPKWGIRLLLGEGACLLLDSLRAKPKRLTEIGFQFSFSHLEPALKNLVSLSNKG
ncbi:TIGR01777 family protein [Vibrio sp. SM6]|uniref:TIGR01777 family protein n=1 Tax=Vibrio agarilyticus TaxID=2726741 RepID=A0A7X8YFK4_9VIBR|nr:TIGR01777 family oxidoreductase [Vibrio agarilyticus]NLS11605.1 TIGR01777 family protein [Vibrio agarilyticus]